MVARKRRVTRKTSGGFANAFRPTRGAWRDKYASSVDWMVSKQEAKRAPERAKVQQTRAQKAQDAESAELKRNEQRAKIYASRAKVLEQKTRARIAGRRGRASFWNPKALSTKRKIGGKSISFW